MGTIASCNSKLTATLKNGSNRTKSVSCTVITNANESACKTPTVTAVGSTTDNGSYNTSQTIVITITFSEEVKVTGTPQLTLETGAADAVVNYTSGTGSKVLVFNYTPTVGHVTSD
ncbi:MAG: hypothetical protein NT027_09345, partial [Proteobacteria bacterium]|nr:hypothetical protein [Pseudomonadota bacterium]